MGLTTRNNYRRFLFVNTFVIVLLGAALAGGGVFWSLPAGLGEGYHNVQAQVREIERVLFWRVLFFYGAISILIIIAMAVLHLFYSHRIAGPAYRMGLEAVRIARGDISGNIRFRQKDNLTDMAESLNDLASQYRSRLNAIRDCLVDIETQSHSMTDLIRQGKDRTALRQAADAITNNVKNMERSLLEMRT